MKNKSKNKLNKLNHKQKLKIKKQRENNHKANPHQRNKYKHQSQLLFKIMKTKNNNNKNQLRVHIKNNKMFKKHKNNTNKVIKNSNKIKNHNNKININKILNSKVSSLKDNKKIIMLVMAKVYNKISKEMEMMQDMFHYNQMTDLISLNKILYMYKRIFLFIYIIYLRYPYITNIYLMFTL